MLPSCLASCMATLRQWAQRGLLFLFNLPWCMMWKLAIKIVFEWFLLTAKVCIIWYFFHYSGIPMCVCSTIYPEILAVYKFGGLAWNLNLAVLICVVFEFTEGGAQFYKHGRQDYRVNIAHFRGFDCTQTKCLQYHRWLLFRGCL